MVALISKDTQLFVTCSEILAGLGHQSVLIDPIGTAPAQTNPDLLILDWSPDLPGTMDWAFAPAVQALYLVERGQNPLCSPDLPAPPAGILTKPVSRDALKLALEQALSRPPAADRDELLQCLLQAYLRLQEYDYDRTNFLARAAHDFRAPLTAISGYCGLFLEGSLGGLEPSQKEVLYRIQRSAHRLSRVATAMFELTSTQRARERFFLRPDSIENCIEQAIQEIRSVSEDKDICVSLRFREGCPDLCFDACQVEQVLVNLLDNACRYTPKHGLIEVAGYPYFCERRAHRVQSPAFERRTRHTREPNMFRIDVKDSGPPVPPELLPLMFEECIPYSNPDDRSGGGLGLAVCKLIVHAHQGQIWARSGPNGVVFSFALPLPTAAHPAEYPFNQQPDKFMLSSRYQDEPAFAVERPQGHHLNE